MQKKPSHYFVVRSPFAEMILTGAKTFEFRSNAKTFACKRLAVAVAQSKGSEKELEEEAKLFRPYFEGEEEKFEKALEKAKRILRKGTANGMVIGEVETGEVSAIAGELGVSILKAKLWPEKEWVKSPGGLGIRYMPGVPRGTEAETVKLPKFPEGEKALILAYPSQMIPDIINGKSSLTCIDYFPPEFNGKVFLCDKKGKEDKIVGMFETRCASKFHPYLMRSKSAKNRVLEMLRISGSKHPAKELSSWIKDSSENDPPYYWFPVLHPQKLKTVPLKQFMETYCKNPPQKRLFPDCLEISIPQGLDLTKLFKHK